MKLTKCNSLIVVDNGHWTATHDLKQGGALTSVVFHKGRNGNLLAGPLAMGIGPQLDIHEKQTSVTIREDHDKIALLFTGTLKDSSGAGTIRYAQSWIYRDYGAHRSQQIYFDAPPDLRELIVACLGVARPYHHVLVEAPSQKWHDGLGEDVHYAVVPQTFGFFADTGEGIQLIRGDDISAWGYNPVTLDTTFGDFRCASSGTELAAELRPFRNHPTPSAVFGSAKESLSFDSFVGITNYKARPYLPYSEVSVTSQPFPSDAEIRAFHEMGVNVLRIHEGANYVNRTIDHWMDGVFPPYEGGQLMEMKRMIRTAHMYGMRVIPYFMPQGFHPLAEAFRQHPREWQKMVIPNSTMIFSAIGDGQVWETYTCLESQFHSWLLEHVTQVISEYDFDGLYFDAPNALASCFHPLHARTPHGCEEAFIRLMLALRKRFPGRLFFHHQMSTDVNVIHANLVDHIINLEEYGLKLPEELRPLPFGFTVQRACASIGPVMQPFLSKDGEAVGPGLVMVKYKPGKEPTCTRALARRGLPYVIVHGAIPYVYTFMEGIMLGYHTSRDRMEDQEGFYYFYRLLKCLRDYDVQEYYAPAEQALKIGAKQVDAAALKIEGGLILLITSTNEATLRDVTIEPAADFMAVLRPEAWQSAEMLASTCDVRLSVTQGRDLILDIVPPNELWIIKITTG